MLMKLGLFCPEKRQLRGHFINKCKYLKGMCQEDEARLFSVQPSDRTRGNGHKLNRMKGEQFEGDIGPEQVAQKGCGVFLPGDTRNPPGCEHVQPAPGEPTLAREWTG
ncbi:hypothetical protein WISP_78930 [Willisornis vidua]|uniref:Uncharacterized protein n=1 Tax=Willisornis vidua TaxID=1566151 RepID=A0ABQ9D571_9PASS|nr:hypothetical protein WISP_78930 [Willisornis vidua]